MRIDEAARMVHQNAVEHGWWDAERNCEEIDALIHSEWSEALEEARSGRPNVYKLDRETNRLIQPDDPEYAGCAGKPDGIAVELIDGCIRILDWFGWVKEGMYSFDMDQLYQTTRGWPEYTPDVAMLVSRLHGYTARAVLVPEADALDTWQLLQAMKLALYWIHDHGIDPEKLMMEKHDYNRGRPYRHGKKF